MTPRQLLDGLRDGNYHSGGIRCLQLLRLHDDSFARLAAEVENLSQHEDPSHVREKEHITNWTRPRGEVTQFSLINHSGLTSDFSQDHDLSSFGKRFHLGDKYRMLASFIDTFPDITNFRANVLGPGAQLAAHEEHSIIRTQTGSICACIRYHLPLMTNPGAELTLDGHVFHLEAGTIYLVNQGCVHSARNTGTKRRVHLVWDQLLTRQAYEAVFAPEVDPAFGVRIQTADQVPGARRVERIGAYMRLPSPVDREAAEHLDLCNTQ